MSMEKYQLTITSAELSIRPYFGFLPKIKVLAVLSAAIFCTAPFLRDLLPHDVMTVTYILGGIFLFYAAYDYLINANVKFVFDKNTGSIYRTNGVFPKKRLMGFEEMTVLTASDNGLVSYAIGRKKKQFTKNYSISAPFGNGKKDQAREAEYVDKILNPILAFVNYSKKT